MNNDNPVLNNGDLIAWRRLINPTKSNFYLNLVRWATLSEFGHVSIVWNRYGQPGHVEATQPSIRNVILPLGEAYVIPMGLNLNDLQMEEFFSDKLGLKYSIRDALMVYVGMTPSEEDRYQCAELALDFYRHVGLDIQGAYTPSRLVRQVMQHTGKSMFYLKG